MIYFLLPAYNEEENIGIVLKNIKENFSDKNHCVVLVNDGSTDKTEEIAVNEISNLNLKIFSHKKNLGLGKALKTGFEYILDNCSTQDIVITLDSDNTHPIEISKKMVEKILAGDDIVIASRYCPGAGELGLILIRKLLSRGASFIFSTFFKYSGVKDYTSGYRAYRTEFLLKMKNFYSDKFITETGFPAGTELLLKSFIFKPKVGEIPFILRYDLKKGSSKLKLLSTIFSYVMLILKLKFYVLQKRDRKNFL